MKNKGVIVHAKQEKNPNNQNNNFVKVKLQLLFALWQCPDACSDVPPGSAPADSNGLHQEFII